MSSLEKFRLAHSFKSLTASSVRFFIVHRLKSSTTQAHLTWRNLRDEQEKTLDFQLKNQNSSFVSLFQVMEIDDSDVRQYWWN